MMPLWGIAIAVAAAGLVGGLASAYYIQNRSLLDEDQATEAGASPTTTREAVATYLGNGLIGAVAGCVSWAGALGSAELSASGELTFTALTTAFFVGLAGPKWLQSERDKARWQAVTSEVAVKSPNPELQATLSMASSDQAVQIARAAPSTESGGPRVPRPRSEPRRQGRGGRPGEQEGGPPRGQGPQQQEPYPQQQPQQQRSQQQGPYPQQQPRAGSLRETGELPIEDYDSLNVNQVTQRLQKLSAEEIERLQDYEAEHKNRRSLMQRFETKVRAARRS